ncbi:hypothetical protein [Flavobacterium sp.]|uniref:hypothetical protein n=1 Tax=Flavobacterium sp. TaxID=239 RepID=UPI0012233E26|nr:hypothetical protein [Flavobacterium sp.]RZJ69262.1 MAG: hypothetical protein EOO49_18040 [Flavobacterium sp.]
MTGIDFGIGTLIACALLSVVFVPLVSVFAIRQFVKITRRQILFDVAVFLIFATLTFSLIRIFGVPIFAFFLVYAIVLLIVGLLRRRFQTDKLS